MKILQELKAAQEQIEKDVEGLYFSLDGNFPYIDVSDEEGSREVAAVLRRIPQLIETLEWLEAKEKEWQEVFEKYLFEAPETAKKCEAKAIFARQLLSKLEEGASKDASEK